VGRKSDDADTIRVRLQNASRELEFATREGKYEYTVVNDNFHYALEELTRILEKEIGETAQIRPQAQNQR
jgi:guanylate kinase